MKSILEASVISFLGIAYQIYLYMILAYVLLSWLPNARASFIGVTLGKLVEPYLAIFRRFIPAIGGVIDISPIVAIIALRFVFFGIEAIARMILP